MPTASRFSPFARVAAANHAPDAGAGAGAATAGAGAGAGAVGSTTTNAAGASSAAPVLVDSRSVKVLSGHTSEVFICAWSPTEDKLASGCVPQAAVVGAAWLAWLVTSARFQIWGFHCPHLGFEPQRSR